MKCCIMAIGGAGERAARALGYCALAGVVEADSVEILLVDADAGDAALPAWCADYVKLRAMWAEGEQPRNFHTALNCRLWPGELPGDVSTLRSLAAAEEDQLLLQALFDSSAADADLRQGFRGRSDVAAAFFTGLIGSGNTHPVGALEDLLGELEQAAAADEPVRVVLLGSAMGGMGSAGLTVLTDYLRKRLPQAELAVGALLPYFRGEEDQLAQARATLKQWSEDGLCDTVFLAGLEQSAYLTAAEGHQLARLPEWLAAAFAADFFRTGRKGMYAWRTAYDSFGWEAFGADAQRYRHGFGGLMKASLALDKELAEVIRRGVSEPRWLRDKLIGWYAHHFTGVRRMEGEARQSLADRVETLLRVMSGYRSWMEEIIATLPPQLRSGSAMDAAIRASEENYDQLVRLSAKLTMLLRSAEASGLATEKTVHRGDYTDTEAEAMQAAIEQHRKALSALEEQQQACIKRTGGQAHLAMLREKAAQCRQEVEQFRAQTLEAEQLIQRAEEHAELTQRSRIDTAKVKLHRMEQSLELLQARHERVLQDIAKAKAEGVRTIPPDVPQDASAASCALFDADAMASADRKELDNRWHTLLKGDAVTMTQLRDRIAAAPPEADPLAGFVAALMNHVMEGDNG